MYQIFSDGGCSPNPGPGGWAYIVERDGAFLRQDSGRDDATTNNKMELTAAIRGLAAVPPGSRAVLCCDSQYVTRGLSEWRANWKRHGWAGVKNADLWRELDALADGLELEVEWVRGHAGHPQNEECDRMATLAYRSDR